MSLSYHGGWTADRAVYLQTRTGKVLLGRLYDRLPAPPLPWHVERALARIADEIRASIDGEDYAAGE
jgi:hypothetical protein